MSLEKEAADSPAPSRPLALHIRAKRRLYPEGPLSQAELARRSGIPVDRLGRLERARDLPGPVADLVTIAMILGVPVEHLISPHYFNKRDGGGSTL